MRQIISSLSALAFLLLTGVAQAETQLYETGPAEESAYVRFVNASGKSISVLAAKGTAKVQLDASGMKRVSKFFRVKSGEKLTATLQRKGTKQRVEVVGKTEEYLTIAILPDGATGIKTRLVTEIPDDFNAMRASLALFNLDEACAEAQMQGGAKRTTIFNQVGPLAVQRRFINPVKLMVNVSCSGAAANMDVDMAQLEAGARYSVFLLPSGNSASAFAVKDER